MAGSATSDGQPRPNDVERVAAAELRTFLERLERLAEEKQTIADDMKDVMGEAKGRGYDTTMIREMLKLRKMDRDERLNREATRQTYGEALGIFA